MQGKNVLTAAPTRIRGPYGIVSPYLTKFVDPIRGIGGTGIPLAAADNFVAPVTGVQHFTIDIGQYNDVLHSDFVKPGRLAFIRGFKGTKLRGYGQGGKFKHLGGVILAMRDRPLQITFENKVPNTQIIPNDITIPQPEGVARWNRTAIHLHGAHVHWISDGGPHHWWAPDGTTGPSFRSNLFNPSAQPGQAEYYYPNDQSGRLMWYHDHAWGITRTNAYAGMATAYVLIDPVAVS